MKKKLITFTVCLAMILSFANFSITVSADSYFSGSGTEQDPYLIQTAADLTQLATLTNTAATGTTYAVGKYYKLTADIDMSGAGAYMPISRATGVGGSHTLPGGTTFKSTFDGDGHIIRNVTMTAQTLAAGGNTYGIIGWLGMDGVVKNLGVENIAADGGSTATALCIGGIVGTIGGGTAQPCAIQNCYVRGMTVTATANGSQYVGGIVGRTVGQKGSIDNCYATDLSYTLANTNYAAGILGCCGNSAHTASNCYTTHSKVQGTAQYPPTSSMETTKCYALGAIANATVANLGSTFFQNDTYEKNSGYPLLDWEIIFTGKGTASNPFLISTASDLTTLASKTNTETATNTTEKTIAATYAASGLYYKLTADIDMSGISYTPISWGTDMYTPQGARFSATLDGDAHIIKNISISTACLSNYGSTAGVIGILGANGTVKNLGVENMTATTGGSSPIYMCIGGIAGSLMAGISIDKCYVRGMTVNAASAGSPVQIGGIAGRTIGNSGTITNCYTTGLSFTATNDGNHSAGIMGSCGNAGYGATNCYTTYSTIQGYAADTGSYIRETNCYASGTIANATAAALGTSNFKNDNFSKNSGHALLLWEKDLEADSFTFTEADGTLTASANVTNYTPISHNLYLIIAKYDNAVQTELKQFAIQPFEVNSSATASDSLAVSKENGRYYKAFLWHSDNNLNITNFSVLDYTE